MQISAPTNFNFELIDRLKGRIHDTYGSLNHDPGETVLPSYALPKVSMERLKKYIEYSHARGIKFNYIMNHPNFTLDGRRIAFLKELSGISVDMVTASNPDVISFLKKNHRFKICSSIACRIDSIERAMFYKNLGCDILCVDYGKKNDLNFIELLRKKTGLQIKILANNICLVNCPYEEEHLKKTDYFGKEIVKCLKLKLDDPSSIVRRTGFIHPNKIETYERLGVDFLKIAGRTKPTQWVVNCVTAYSQKNCKGNCLRLINTSVLESKYSSLIRILLGLLSEAVIRNSFKYLHFLYPKEIFKVLSREKHIKSLLRIYTTKNVFYVDDKRISIDEKKKEYLLKEVSKVLEEA